MRTRTQAARRLACMKQVRPHGGHQLSARGPSVNLHGPLSIPGLHLPTGSLESGPQGRGRFTPGARLCQLLSREAALSSECLSAFMQHRCRPGTKSFATGAHPTQRKGGTGRAGDQTRAAEGAWESCVVSPADPRAEKAAGSPRASLVNPGAVIRTGPQSSPTRMAHVAL